MMAKDRPDALTWIGEHLADGRPVSWHADIPARDLTADETAALSDEQIDRAVTSKLYQGAAADTTEPIATPPTSGTTGRTKPGKEE